MFFGCFKDLEFWHSMYDEDHVLMPSVWQKVTVLKKAVNVMYILGQPLHLYMWKQWCDQAVHWLQNFNFYLHAYFTVQALRLLSCQHKLNKYGKYVSFFLLSEAFIYFLMSKLYLLSFCRVKSLEQEIILNLPNVLFALFTLKL